MRPQVLLVAACLLISAPALAQPADARVTAEEQFKVGREAMTRGDYKGALDLLRRSQGLEPGRGKLLNIALCEEQLGLFGSAWKHFREVAAQLPTGDDREPIVKQHLDDLAPRVPYLRLGIAPGAPAATTVTLDGAVVAPASLATDLAVDPGKHVVMAAAPGATERRYELTVSGAGRRELEVAPQVGAVAPAPTPPPREQAAPPHGRAWTIGIAVAGVGGASLLAGVGTGAAAIAKHGATAKLCPTPSTCPAGVQPDIEAYNRLGAASTAMFVVGGALAATGVILVVTSRRGERPPANAWIGPGMLGVQGRF